MKVLHVINSLAAGGAEKLVAELATAQALENKVTLFSLSSNNDIFQEKLGENIEFVSFPTASLYSFKKMKVLHKLIKENQIIHTHLFPAFYYVAFLSIFNPSKVYVYTEHNTHNNRRKSIFWLLEKCVYSRFTIVICISKGVKESLENWIGTSVPKKIISNFLDINNVKSTETPQPSKLDLIDTTGIPLVMVGSFTAQKDQETIIKALIELPEAFELYLIGDGPKRKNVELLVEKLGLKRRVHFLGIQKNVIPLLKRAKYGILSSYWEGFGIVALEYMGSNLITLGTNVSGLNEVISIQENRFPIQDALALANRIIEIEKEPRLQKSILEDQNRLLKKYDITNAVSAHLDLYKIYIE
ncbi:glycosyltransferase [Rasiella sp. SM2506]|uniref:glycosyltransferase n=1 Tax=Rasiella sp. SM2506 TaxID=3423914 RepID=UPI003D7B3F4A